MSIGHQCPWRGCLSTVFVVTTVAASKLLAHDGKLDASYDAWIIWSWEPGIIFGLTFSAWLYIRGTRSLWPASTLGRGMRRREVMAFGAGWLAFWAALVSPLHSLGGTLFSVHMIQHTILMVVDAPLLVLSRPLMPYLRGLPLPLRRRLVRAGTQRWVQRGWHTLTNPLLAWSLHGIGLWLWHVPGLFQVALESELIQAMQHLSFLGFALLFWWALIHGRQGSVGYGAAVFYVFTTAMHSGGLGALLTFAPTLWYPAYAGSTASWGLTPVEDQQLAGLIMWVPTGVLYLIAGLALFAGWLRALDRRGLPREGQAWP
jgi:putative membrane protein